MSTKAIWTVLELARRDRVPSTMQICDAEREIEAIERAAKVWWTRDDVMERIEDAGQGGFETVRSIAKDAP